MMRLLVILFLSAAAVAQAPESYVLGPDSQRQPGVPAGTVTKFSWTSRIYPGTVRDYWVYVPAQYRPEKPACLMIFQDGERMQEENSGWRVPIVFDNLIHKGEMPATIGVFVNPGVLPSGNNEQQNRFNRSYEYDALGDRYASFLIDEIIPEVARRYNISANPDDRAIAGSSSGAIAAFNAAWTRPDSFHRVLSFIGSFVNLRGGQNLASLIRKSEPKPLRVFLQDGRNDNNIYSGNWYLANQDLASALDYAGYESTFVVGSEGHNAKHGGAILPDALRWLWKDYPRPVSKSQVVRDRGVYSILDPGREWELLGSGFAFLSGLAVSVTGDVYFADSNRHRIGKIDGAGRITTWKEDAAELSGLAFGGNGWLYGCDRGGRRVVALSPNGTERTIAGGFDCVDLAVTKDNDVYASDPQTHGIWLLNSKGERRSNVGRLAAPLDLSTSPDQFLLLIGERGGRWVWSFQRRADGSLVNGQPFYRLETPDESSESGAEGMAVDSEGFLYVATRMGIQVCDQPGRLAAIIETPHNTGPGKRSSSSVALGGDDMQWLYLTVGDKIYRRHILRKGVTAATPLKPPVPRL